MREIKFRAWDKENNQWLFNYKNYDGCSLMGEIVMLRKWDSIPLEKFDFIQVMQYTGLKDKNGKEIYEGDILTACRYPGSWVVTWTNNQYTASFVIKRIKDNLSASMKSAGINKEIIGNIYEHSNLLK